MNFEILHLPLLKRKNKYSASIGINYEKNFKIPMKKYVKKTFLYKEILNHGLLYLQIVEIENKYYNQ